MTEVNKKKLIALIQANLHSANDFLDAAEVVDDSLQEMKFRAWARERTQQAQQLCRCLNEFAPKNEDENSQDWLDEVSLTYSRNPSGMADDEVQDILTNAADCEELLERMYQQLLADPDVLPLNRELKQHYAQVRAIRFNVTRLCG